MALLRVVMDTNIVVSAHLRTDGRQAVILDLALSRKFEACASEDLFREYQEVLLRPRFRIDPGLVAESMNALRRVAIVVVPKKRLDVSGDADDNKVMECAVEAGAQYIVTGNTRHFPSQYMGTHVVSPVAFMEIIAAQME